MRAIVLISCLWLFATWCNGQLIIGADGKTALLSKYLYSHQFKHKSTYYAITSGSGVKELDPIADAPLISRYFSIAGMRKIFLENPDQIGEFPEIQDSVLVYGSGQLKPTTRWKAFRLKSIPLYCNFSLYNQSNYPYYTGIRSYRGGITSVSFLLSPRDSAGNVIQKLLFLK